MICNHHYNYYNNLPGLSCNLDDMVHAQPMRSSQIMKTPPNPTPIKKSSLQSHSQLQLATFNAKTRAISTTKIIMKTAIALIILVITMVSNSHVNQTITPLFWAEGIKQEKRSNMVWFTRSRLGKQGTVTIIMHVHPFCYIEFCVVRSIWSFFNLCWMCWIVWIPSSHRLQVYSRFSMSQEALWWLAAKGKQTFFPH